ncbi:hypothetical protein JI664_04910 [Rhodobacter sp. NTK016B]|uniref:hypothetical protein n=1 Tax=Rhodobacter sp. NTK016B TaxID=2759676 RepID=UPI001A904A0D|nr:hypothetical protein [Rhodobacter sp. NTK016B]MBN8291297.1 hypothetical protein [Rhodobacter sp. NTK016B]
MTPTTSATPNSATQTAAARLVTVMAAWNKAPDSAKKAAALKHYEAAETAHSRKDEANCIKECKAAEQALV